MDRAAAAAAAAGTRRRSRRCGSGSAQRSAGGWFQRQGRGAGGAQIERRDPGGAPQTRQRPGQSRRLASLRSQNPSRARRPSTAERRLVDSDWHGFQTARPVPPLSVGKLPCLLSVNPCRQPRPAPRLVPRRGPAPCSTCPSPSCCTAPAACTAQHFDPAEVQVSTLLSVKTGGCPEDCGYCPQAARYHTGVEAHEADEHRGGASRRPARPRPPAPRASAWARRGARRRTATSRRSPR